MALLCNDTALDALLNWISSGGSTATLRLGIWSTDPPTYITCTATGYAVGLSSKGAVTFTGPADSSISGRKLTIDQTSDIAARKCSTMRATHVGLFSTQKLIFITKCSSRTLSTSDTLTVPAWSIHVLDPATST